MPAWRLVDGVLELLCHVQPGAKLSEFAGLYGDALRLRIAAPAVEGRANAACLAFLARAFGVRQAAVKLISGEGSRRKRFAISGAWIWPEQLRAMGHEGPCTGMEGQRA